MKKKKPALQLSAAELAVLAAVDGVGKVTVRRLLQALTKHEVSFGEFWDKLPTALTKITLSNKQIHSIKSFKKEHTISSYRQHLSAQQIQPITVNDNWYPPLLRLISDRPLLLFVKGSLDALTAAKPLAVVGSRRATPYGAMATKYLVSQLVKEEGTAIISGFMYGIDSLAHQTALDAGGVTVGVLGFGFNHLYPPSNVVLYEQILTEGGALISEYAPHISPKAGNFAVRNRIVAGMVQGVIVVEAAAKSGSHITAQVALDEGRAVFAVPGPIMNPFSEGTKWLLNEGAALVSSAADVAAVLSPSWPEWGLYTSKPSQESFSDDDFVRVADTTEKIYKILLAQPMSTQALHQQVPLSIVELNTLLTELELRGRIHRQGPLWTATI
jgi:DNA processing protein